ncbi:MAG: DUF3836 domain-containing protein [Bacteroides sp.]
MKSSRFSKVMAVALFAMALVISGNVLAQSPEDYIKNDIVEQGVVKERIIYVNNDGVLERHIHYVYTYNEKQQVTSKQAEKWDTLSDRWIPYFKMEMSYEGNTVNVTYARWNKRSKAYDKDIQNSSYEMNDGLMEQLMANK